VALAAVVAQSGGKPRFEVASVKACKVNTFGTNGGSMSPGRVTVHCEAVVNLVRRAYAVFADGKENRGGERTTVDGGPRWAYDDLWEIEAKSDGKQKMNVMAGPMMQSLLEERFKLKVHRETRQVPVYVLTASKGGVKLPAAKQGCFVLDEDHRPPALPPEQLRLLRCGSADPRNQEFHMRGASMDDLAYALSRVGFDRRVLDRTGLAGQYDIDFKWGTPDEGTMLEGYQAALAKLGLKLESGTGPGEFLIIDHVERPAEN
jgi:uncharacterized protein (TIGR03435 family)